MISTMWDALRKSWINNGRLKFIIVAFGIFISYFFVGYLQETTMRGTYGADKFDYAMTVALVQNFMAFIIIQILVCVGPRKKDETPIWYYIIAGVVFSLAMACTTYALVYVTFPTQVVFKSAKPIAVMLINLFMCKRYTLQRYFFVSLIVVGLIMFNVSGDKKKDKNVKEDQQMWGIAILSFSLLMDGTLGAIEDRVRRLYSPTSNQMMVAICGWSSATLIIAVCATQEVVGVYQFANRHPEIIWQLGLLGILGAVGQLFIFTMVTSFGALPTSVTTTVRKFISVVFSIIFMGNGATPLQWGGTAVVFSALLADAAWGKKQFFGKKKAEIKPTSDPNEFKPTAPTLEIRQPTGQDVV